MEIEEVGKGLESMAEREMELMNERIKEIEESRQAPTVDQLIDNEIQAAVGFFKASDRVRSKIRNGDVEVVELLVLKRRLRDWVQMVLEKQRGMEGRKQ